MKQKIIFYLLLFFVLIALYQFISTRNMIQAKNGLIEAQAKEMVQMEDSIRNLQFTNLETQYFSLDNNDDALAYYDHLKLESPSQYITDKLLETNETKGDNPLVPYAGMEGDFKINKIKVLNHKWILADFSDGQFWGELFIKYELKDDLGVDFSLLDHFLYTRSN
ncbi:MAG: hydrolase [Arenibacter sp.]|uniref:hydrolase n=1 Tax=Arenibacter TaxID=178469 RepID=UPI000A38AF3A|nr:MULTISPECIES: hydrolase [Arenibacter]MDX1328930.1 hydrolase [Arenibacter sp.]